MKTKIAPSVLKKAEAAIRARTTLAARSTDREEKSMYAGDAKDMRRVLDLIKQGRFLEASNKLDHMDTEPREFIWDILRGSIMRGLKVTNPKLWQDIRDEEIW